MNKLIRVGVQIGILLVVLSVPMFIVGMLQQTPDVTTNSSEPYTLTPYRFPAILVTVALLIFVICLYYEPVDKGGKK